MWQSWSIWTWSWVRACESTLQSPSILVSFLSNQIPPQNRMGEFPVKSEIFAWVTSRSNRLEYLDMVLSESMRVYPPIPLHIGEFLVQSDTSAKPHGGVPCPIRDLHIGSLSNQIPPHRWVTSNQRSPHWSFPVIPEISAWWLPVPTETSALMSSWSYNIFAFVSNWSNQRSLHGWLPGPTEIFKLMSSWSTQRSPHWWVLPVISEISAFMISWSTHRDLRMGELPPIRDLSMVDFPVQPRSPHWWVIGPIRDLRIAEFFSGPTDISALMSS